MNPATARDLTLALGILLWGLGALFLITLSWKLGLPIEAEAIGGFAYFVLLTVFIDRIRKRYG